MNHKAFFITFFTLFQAASLWCSDQPKTYSHKPYKSLPVNPPPLPTKNLNAPSTISAQHTSIDEHLTNVLHHATNALYDEFCSKSIHKRSRLHRPPPLLAPQSRSATTQHIPHPFFKITKEFLLLSESNIEPSLSIVFTIHNHSESSKIFLENYRKKNYPTESEAQRQQAIAQQADPELVAKAPEIIIGWLINSIRYEHATPSKIKLSILLNKDKEPLTLNYLAPQKYIFASSPPRLFLNQTTKTFTITAPLRQEPL